MNRYNGKRTAPDNNHNPESQTAERRRIGQIVHDDRGSASVRWRDAPLDHERQKLELEDTRSSGRSDSRLRGGLTLELRNDDTFNPYDRSPDKSGSPKGGKRDLKKLSEWVKLMRAMEERKRNGESE